MTDLRNVPAAPPGAETRITKAFISGLPVGWTARDGTVHVRAPGTGHALCGWTVGACTDTELQRPELCGCVFKESVNR
jgi:hypothetical protein